MNDYNYTNNQPNTQYLPFQATSPRRAQPITAAEKVGVIVAMQTVAGDTGGFDWYSSRQIAGGKCWNCHQDAGTITLPSGGKCCANCGAAR